MLSRLNRAFFSLVSSLQVALKPLQQHPLNQLDKDDFLDLREFKEINEFKEKWDTEMRCLRCQRAAKARVNDQATTNGVRSG